VILKFNKWMVKMEDYLVRAIATAARVRAIACVTTELAQEGVQRHETQPAVTVALGQALTGVALMGSLLKMRQRVALKFQGDGPLQKMIVESDHNGYVRGYASAPEADFAVNVGHLNLVEALGADGLLVVVKDLRLDELYEGVVPLVAGDVGDNLTAYFTQSEQTDTLVVTSVQLAADGTIAASGGLLLQALPGFEGDLIIHLREKLQELPPIAAMLLSGQSLQEVLTAVLGDIPHKILIEKPLVFQCSCSLERTIQALAALGSEEIQAILDTEGQAMIDCHFCHEHYVISGEALEELLVQLAAE
jgi:molecular chaperone Hsp33